jgi:RimJ/RimL family protein N-acetyltransferase
VREDHSDAVGFAEKRGYREVMRTWENHLDMGSYDPAPFREAAAAVLATGISIHRFADLEADPEHYVKLHDLTEEVANDVPSPEPRTPRVFDDLWIARINENPGLMREAYMIAVDDTAPGRPYVGLSNLWKNQASDDLDTGLTGVRRAYRRRGLAIALKLASLDEAKRLGAPRVRTWNASNNMGMLAINERLGFRRQPAWIEYLRELEHAD